MGLAVGERRVAARPHHVDPALVADATDERRQRCMELLGDEQLVAARRADRRATQGRAHGVAIERSGFRDRRLPQVEADEGRFEGIVWNAPIVAADPAP